MDDEGVGFSKTSVHFYWPSLDGIPKYINLPLLFFMGRIFFRKICMLCGYMKKNQLRRRSIICIPRQIL
jgi:hypothetical protein